MLTAEQFYQEFTMLPQSMQTELVHYMQFLKQKSQDNDANTIRKINQEAIDELNSGELETITFDVFKRELKDILAQ